MLPEAFVDRGQQGGQAIGPESVDKVQAGAASVATTKVISAALDKRDIAIPPVL